jgi:hypothetical protein
VRKKTWSWSSLAITKHDMRRPPPTAQYSVLKGFAVSMSSLLLGASVVHNIFKPDLSIPDLDEAAGAGDVVGADDRT